MGAEVLALVGAVLAPLLVYIVQRRQQLRQDRVDPVTAAANAAVAVAGAVEDVIAPLREQLQHLTSELALARLEIHELRGVIEIAGLTAPPRRVRID